MNVDRLDCDFVDVEEQQLAQHFVLDNNQIRKFEVCRSAKKQRGEFNEMNPNPQRRVKHRRVDTLSIDTLSRLRLNQTTLVTLVSLLSLLYSISNVEVTLGKF